MADIGDSDAEELHPANTVECLFHCTVAQEGKQDRLPYRHGNLETMPFYNIVG